jgi:hypothetical protein
MATMGVTMLHSLFVEQTCITQPYQRTIPEKLPTHPTCQFLGRR